MKPLFAPFAALMLALLTLASPARAGADLKQISDYLDTLTSVEADFVQYNPDGSAMPGTMYLKRPGRVRFEYAGENAPLVLISGGQVAVFDPLSNEPPFRFPVSATPLDTILGRDVDLTDGSVDTHLMESGDFTILNAQDPKFAEYGYVSLVFDTDPLMLRQWVVIDGSGRQTTIALKTIKPNASIRTSVFNIRSEMRRRGWEE